MGKTQCQLCVKRSVKCSLGCTILGSFNKCSGFTVILVGGFRISYLFPPDSGNPSTREFIESFATLITTPTENTRLSEVAYCSTAYTVVTLRFTVGSKYIVPLGIV